jgi:hypothetical protein
LTATATRAVPSTASMSKLASVAFTPRLVAGLVSPTVPALGGFWITMRSGLLARSTPYSVVPPVTPAPPKLLV